ncbi:MAG: Porin P [Pseudomonadales bacterium]|nr:Porin P [Pseudomonadales bacterium]
MPRKPVLSMPALLVMAVGICAPVPHAVASTSEGLSIVSDDGRHSLRLGGRLHGDFNAWDGVTAAVPGDEENEVFLRRARLELRGRTGDWQLLASYNLVDEGSYDQLYLSYRGFGELARITFGQQKEDFGLDSTGGSNWITGIERAIPAMAFDPARNVGLKLHGGDDRFSYSIGTFREDLDDSRALDHALSGRLVVRPLYDAGRLLHVGVGITRRGGVAADYSARLGVRGGEDGSGAGRVRARLAGMEGERRDRVVETAARFGALHAMAEHFRGEIEPDQGGQDIETDGWYLTVAYVLTGEQRDYRAAEAVFDAVKPASPGGAWELFARYDTLDVSNPAPVEVYGARARSLTLGVNWYLNEALRCSLNWLRVDTGRAIGAVDDGDAVLARLQFVF